MKEFKNILLWLFLIAACYQLTADQPIHNSIYNTPSSSNAIYNGYNLFIEDSPFSEQMNGDDDDLDVEDQDDDQISNDNPRHNNMLQKAILDHNTKEIQDLIYNENIDVNYQNKDGRTALHFAADQDNNKIVLLLLQHGADCHKADLQGWTPLHVAVNANAFEVVKTLLDHKADLFAQDIEEKNPIDYAKNDFMKSILQGSTD